MPKLYRYDPDTDYNEYFTQLADFFPDIDNERPIKKDEKLYKYFRNKLQKYDSDYNDKVQAPVKNSDYKFLKDNNFEISEDSEIKKNLDNCRSLDDEIKKLIKQHSASSTKTDALIIQTERLQLKKQIITQIEHLTLVLAQIITPLRKIVEKKELEFKRKRTVEVNQHIRKWVEGLDKKLNLTFASFMIKERSPRYSPNIFEPVQRKTIVVDGISFYCSTGHNSSAPDTWLPYFGVTEKSLSDLDDKQAGWLIKAGVFLQNHMPTDVDFFEHITNMKHKDNLHFRFCSPMFMVISAKLGGGFWDTDDGNKVKISLEKYYGTELFTITPKIEITPYTNIFSRNNGDGVLEEQVNNWLKEQGFTSIQSIKTSEYGDDCNYGSLPSQASSSLPHSMR